MKFLADEGVDRSIVNGLRQFNYDVYYVIDEVRSLTDDVLLLIAFNEERILITKDKDFGELVYRLNKVHFGVILIRLEGLSSQERADIVCPLISKYNYQLLKAFTVIQQGIIRIRKT
jgi:predicted nuclease of predicted toxin-antitoxin system